MLVFIMKNQAPELFEQTPDCHISVKIWEVFCLL